MPRTTPPFRADHVGSLLRPQRLLAGAGGLRRRQDPGRGATRDRGRGDPRGGRDAGGGRPAVGHRRRVPARLLAHGLHLSSSTASARPPTTWWSTSRTPTAGSTSPPRRSRSTADRAPQADLRRALRVPRRDGATTRDAEADDPLAEHGPLPRRRGGDRPRGLPRPGRVLERPHRRLRESGEDGRRARLHLPAVRRHQPRLPQRPEAAADDVRARRGRRAPARGATSATSTRRWTGGPTGSRSPPTCAAATSAPRGSPRAATTSSPRRCSASSTSTASSSSTTTRALAASSRCGSCRRASWSCSGS